MTEERSIPADVDMELLDGMLDPVIMIDAHGQILGANRSCETVFGYDPEALRGQNISTLLPEPYRSEHDGYLARYRESGETHILGRTREFPLLHRDGRVLEIELSVSRIDLPGRAAPVFCGSFRDITDRKAAESALAASERLYRAIFDSEFQFVGLLHPDGTVVEINRAALLSIRAERADVIGKPFWETAWWACSTTGRERVREAVLEAASGAFVRFEAEQPRAGGGTSIVDFSLKPVRDEQGEVILLLPEGRDISDIQAARRRELAMMRAFAEIGEASSVLAHEIKNPITAVNLALRAVAKQLGEDEQKTLEELVGRMQGLEALMRRTLSLAKPLDLHLRERRALDLLENARRALAPQLVDAGIEVELALEDDGLVLDVDAGLIDEVLTNLLTNSIEAIGQGGRVRLSARREGPAGLIVVEDDGPGVAPGIAQEALKAFVTTKSEGTGLGLAIARKIVEAHGGSISVGKSSLGGASFELLLPLRADS